MSIPRVDPNVKHVPVSYLRKLNSEVLREETRTLVIDTLDGDEGPLSVLMPFSTFLTIQEQLENAALPQKETK